MTTMRDVGARAGVSAKTVSRVLRNDRYVTDEVRARVLAAVSELHYVPSTLAVSFRSGQDTAIAVAVPDLTDPFFAAATQAIELVARDRGTAVIVSSLGYEPAREQESVLALLKRQVQGLICCPVSSDQSYLQRWQERTPIVFFDREPQRLLADAVVEDDLGGAARMTRHLLDHGHRRIAFLGDNALLSTVALRLDGYRAALADADVAADATLIHLRVVSPADVEAALAQLRRLADPPTAIFSSNGRLSMQVVAALRPMEWTDAALVSFGDFPMARFLDPPITVMDQDPVAVGHAAAEQLFGRIDGNQDGPARRTVLPVDLIERASCAIAGSALR